MAAFSQFMEQQIINWCRATAIATTPSALEIRLHTSNPLDDYSGASVPVAMGYADQTITLSAPSSIVGTGSTTANSGDITFGPASGTWGTITHWSIHGTAGDTNFYFFGAFLYAKTITSGMSYIIPDGSLQIVVR